MENENSIIQEYIDRAKDALDNSRYQDVLDICEDAACKGIEEPRLISGKALALIELKRNKEAKELLKRTLEVYPDNLYLHYHLALAYRNKRIHAERYREFRSALDLAEGVELHEIDERLAVVISDSLISLYRYRDARRFLECVITRFPESAPLNYNLALVYVIKWHWISAIKQSKRLERNYKHQLNKAVGIWAAPKILMFAIPTLVLIIELLSNSNEVPVFFIITAITSIIMYIAYFPIFKIPFLDHSNYNDRWSRSMDLSLHSENIETSQFISSRDRVLKDDTNTPK